MPNLPLPHQPDTNVFRDEVWSGAQTFEQRPPNNPGIPTTDAGLSGGTGFDQIPAGWMKCSECDSPQTLGGTPTLHRDVWHVRHEGEAYRFVGAPSVSASIFAHPTLTPHLLTAPGPVAPTSSSGPVAPGTPTFPAEPPPGVMYHDPMCQNWRAIAMPQGGTNQIGAATIVSDHPNPGGIAWRTFLWSVFSSEHHSVCIYHVLG